MFLTFSVCTNGLFVLITLPHIWYNSINLCVATLFDVGLLLMNNATF